MERKYLDAAGIAHLWSKISMEDYPNNETLIAVLNAIDDTKADKVELANYLLKEDYIKSEAGGEIVLSDYLSKVEAEQIYLSKNEIDNYNYLSKEEAASTYTTKNEILPIVYPVGSIYISTINTNPATLFGFGSWEMIPDVFLLGAGNLYAGGATGGEVNHILTTSEMPSHTHNYLRHQFNNSDGDNGTDVYGANNKTLPQVMGTTEATGNGVAHNNMPPYLAVYI